MAYDVIVVGAGAAGLMAACELSKAGKKVLVLEACDRIGGRIYPLPASEWGYEAQAGGEFIHGAAPITRSLIKKVRLTLTHPVEWWNVLDGKPRVNEQVSPHDPVLEAKLKELKEDLPVTEFLDKYFMGAQYAALRDQVIRRVEGYEAADPRRFSSFGLRSEVVEEGEWQQNNIKEGYGTLLRYLAKDLNIQLQKEVVKVETNDKVVVTCKDNSHYEARQAIVTVPLPILSKIEFAPAIPEKLQAVQKIGFGGVIKILLRFKTKWWASPEREANFERMFFMFSNEEVPTWWTQYPEPHLTLTGWVGGPKAREVTKFSDEEILEKALQSLSNIFKISVSELKQELVLSKIADWVDDPYAGGAYSYATPESAEAVKELQKPIGGKVFFAGEAINEGGSLVESALQSGKETAEKILNS